MPIMNGKEAIKWIRNWEAKDGKEPSKIIIISGNAVEKEIQTCTDKNGPYRAVAFMTKPCDYNGLAKMLSKLGIRSDTRKSLNDTEKEKKKKKIFFADDEYIIIDIMKNFASMLNVEVLVAKNGKEAVEVFEKHSSDNGAILLDDKMPLMTGLEACKEIKKVINNSNAQDVPIYLVSGTKYDPLPPCFTRGLVKPFEFKNIEGITRRINLTM